MRAVNLLPPDTRGASKASAELGAGPEATGGAGAFVVLGVLAACVAGVAGHVLINNTIKQRQADLTEVTQRAQALQSQANQLKPYADFDSMAKARVQTVKDLAGSRFDWEQTLRDLARAIPADVTLKSLTGDISTDAGGGGSTLRTAIAAPAITIAGLRPRAARGRPPDGAPARHRRGHPRVAQQVDRREDRRRGRRRRRDGDRAAQRHAVRRRASVPSFEMVMFFEKDAAAVATTPTTSSGTVSATPTPTPTADARGRHGGHRPRPRPRPPAPGRGDPVSRYTRIADRGRRLRPAPSTATGRSTSRPSAPRPPSSSRRSPRRRPSSRRPRR